MATPIPPNRARFTIDELARATGGQILARPGGALEGVVTDSRAVQPGAIFVALRGANHDGHAFLPDVVAAGAGAVIVDREIPLPPGVGVVRVDDTLRALGDIAASHRRRFDVPVVAIGGSSGKTTTKELAAAALEALGLRTHRTPGNLNNLVGVPMTLLALDETHRASVIELGMSVPGEMARLTRIVAPTVGVVTCVAEEHLEGVGTLHDVAREEGALLLGLSPTAAAVWHADDALLEAYGAASRAATKIRFGAASGDVRLTDVRLADGRTRCTFSVRGLERALCVELAMLGEGPARSAAAALAVALAIAGEAGASRAAEHLAAVAPAPGRARPLVGPKGSTILDDTYNATPRATALALRTAAALAASRGGRAIAVLGDMKELGAESERLHEDIGAQAVTAGVTVLVCCGPAMRDAAAGATRAMLAVGAQGVRVEHVDDPAEAVEILRELVDADDVVLVKGSRAMRMERVIEALRGAADGRRQA